MTRRRAPVVATGAWRALRRPRDRSITTGWPGVHRPATLVPGHRRRRDRPDAVHEGDDQALVELRATRVLEAGQRLVDGQGLAVRPGRRHRGERVAHGQDAGHLRDVLAGQPVQVALPIPALVVVADPGPDLLEVGQLADDEVAERDVLLHRPRTRLR